MINPAAFYNNAPQAYPAWGLPMSTPIASPTYGIRVKDREIYAALNVLAQTENLPQDEAYLAGLGINIIFRNGREALDLIRQKGISVEFGDLGDDSAHAVWQNDQNRMLVNQKYRGNMSPAILYGIAASIYHEAGHAARRGDGESSIQEEIDCLALNTMAYRSHVSKDPAYASMSASGPHAALLENGVALYPKLFFDPDPYKRRLINRIIQKYGDLPPETPDHPSPVLTYGKTILERVLYEKQRQYAYAKQWQDAQPTQPVAG